MEIDEMEGSELKVLKYFAPFASLQDINLIETAGKISTQRRKERGDILTFFITKHTKAHFADPTLYGIFYLTIPFKIFIHIAMHAPHVFCVSATYDK